MPTINLDNEPYEVSRERRHREEAAVDERIMMNNDRKLLELAAKAAGGIYYDDGSIRTEVSGFDIWTEWRPLTDDGDALRLAVKLEMFLDTTIAMQEAADVAANGINVDCGDDPYAATRRAIVRAAAEIGKDMK